MVYTRASSIIAELRESDRNYMPGVFVAYLHVPNDNPDWYPTNNSTDRCQKPVRSVRCVLRIVMYRSTFLNRCVNYTRVAHDVKCSRRCL